jgi:hypothetical protein
VHWPLVDGFREAAVAFREVRVFEVREVLRLWLAEPTRSVNSTHIVRLYANPGTEGYYAPE